MRKYEITWQWVTLTQLMAWVEQQCLIYFFLHAFLNLSHDCDTHFLQTITKNTPLKLHIHTLWGAQTCVTSNVLAFVLLQIKVRVWDSPTNLYLQLCTTPCWFDSIKTPSLLKLIIITLTRNKINMRTFGKISTHFAFLWTPRPSGRFKNPKAQKLAQLCKHF